MHKGTALSLAVVFGCAACGSVKSVPDGSSNAVDSGGGGNIDAPLAGTPDASAPIDAASAPDASPGAPDAGPGPDANVGDFSLALGQTSLTIPYESSGSENLSIARVGSIGAITLSASGLPSGVTATFSPNPVPVGTTTAKLTVHVAPGAPKGAHTGIQIAGKASGITHSATLSVTVQTVTVTGLVRGGVSGVTVALAGGNAVTSDGSGAFTFTNVAPPYDLYTVSNGTVIYYQGLTRLDPTIDASLGFFSIVHTFGTITGSMKGTGVNTANPVIVAWSNGGLTTKFASGPGYSLSGACNGSTQSGFLYGLQWTKNSSGEPTSYPAYGVTKATITASATTTLDLNTAAASTATVSGTVTGPSGYNPPTFTLTQQFGGTSAVLWTGGVSTINAKIPIISAGKTTFYASAKNASGALSEVVFPGLNKSTNVTFSMPPASVLSAPAQNAAGVSTSTAFRWTPPSKTVSDILITTSGNTRVTYNIITARSQITIPVIPQEPLPSGQTFTWSITNYGPFASVDAAAGATDLVVARPNEFAVRPTHFDTLSLSRNFTSQ